MTVVNDKKKKLSICEKSARFILCEVTHLSEEFGNEGSDYR
jgi:hypothetical protein